MRPVLHVISGLRTGGAETMLVALCRALQARGYPQEVVALTEGGPNAAILARLGVPVHVLAPKGARGIAASLFGLARLIRRERPAIVQGWLYHGDLFATAGHALAGRPRASRLAWGLRNSDIDDARYGRLLAIGRRLSRWPDIVISNSQAGADFHLARGYRPRRLAIIPNGIDTGRFRPNPTLRATLRAEIGIAHNAILALHAARVDPMKDHAGLLAAAARVPEVQFLLIGDGTQALSLPENARAFGRRDDAERFAAACDLVVSSSAFGEGFSNALAEGMAAGLVPVATRVGDAATILGDNGLLVAPGNPDALTAAIRSLARERAHLPERGAAARQRIETRFGPAAMADRFVAAWQEAGAEFSG